MLTSPIIKELNSIKKWSKYGCITFSHHCLQRLQERGFNEQQIISVIRRNDTCVIQQHEPDTYHGNCSHLFVLYGKLKENGKNIPMHIVLAKKTSSIGGISYVVVTAYKPSPLLFKANGKLMR